MAFPNFRALLLGILVVTAASASTLTGSITGTCGFFQGTLTNVVYQQAFSGDGTFCTGFQNGGSFTNSGIAQVGDVFALAHNTIGAAAPAGYGAFVNINYTYQVTQEYLLTAPIPPTTATGYLQTFLAGTGTTDDGSGLGSCSEHASVNIAGFSSPSGAQIRIPITFGQPIQSVQTVSISCSDYGAVGRGFGDDGVQEIYAGPLLLLDANGTVLGTPTITTLTPEPSSWLLILLTGSPLLLLHARRKLNDTCRGVDRSAR